MAADPSGGDAVMADAEGGLPAAMAAMREANAPAERRKAARSAYSYLAKLFGKMCDRPADSKARRVREDNPLVRKFVVGVEGARAFCEAAGFRSVSAGKKTFFEIPDEAWRPELAAEARELLERALGEADEEIAKPEPAGPAKKCAANCGFYGSPKTENLCSGCYNKKYNLGGPSQRDTGADGCVEKCGNFGSAKFGGLCGECHKKKNRPRTPKEKWAAALVKVRAVVRFRMACPPRAVQEKKNRCWQCKKKLGISGVECRCGYVFCGKHRYASEHDCRFNYVREQQRKLLRENPALKRDKMDKL